MDTVMRKPHNFRNDRSPSTRTVRPPLCLHTALALCTRSTPAPGDSCRAQHGREGTHNIMPACVGCLVWVTVWAASCGLPRVVCLFVRVPARGACVGCLCGLHLWGARVGCLPVACL